MNLPVQPNPKLFCRRYRLVTLAVAGFYATASTLSSTVLLWLIDSSALVKVARSQTLGDLRQVAIAQYRIGQGNALPLQTRRFQCRGTILSCPATKTGLNPIENRYNHAQLPEFNQTTPLSPPYYPGPPLNVAPPEQFNRYRLGSGDAIAVTVQRFTDLSFQATINPEGNVVVPLLGTVNLAGLTLEGAGEKIRRGLNRYVVDPQVSVALVGLRAVQVTVTGEVVRPGYYTLQPGSVLSAALFSAGGATPDADLRTIVVRRRSPDNRSFIAQQIDLFTPLLNGTSLPDFRLQDGDAVVVSKLEVGTTADYDRTLVSRSSVAQPQINIRVLSYPNGRIGNVTLPNGSTFVDALTAIAPNPDNAKLGEIALIRYDPEVGKAVTQELDGRRALMGDISQNVPLQNDDVIVVGRNLIGRVTYALSLVAQPFTSILGFQNFFDNLSDIFGGDSDDD